MKSAGQAKGQRKIHSFFYRDPKKQKQQAERQAGPTTSQAQPRPAEQHLQPATATPVDNAARPAAPPAAPPPPPRSAASAAGIPPRDPARHEAFQRKLGGPPDSSSGGGGGGALGQRRPRGPSVAEAARNPTQPLSPLEQQIVQLKKDSPGLLLVFEVGYKCRMYGEDAEAASQALRIFCYHDRNFLSASFPTGRMHVHVRRLVEAGHKVGIVSQLETAAEKQAGEKKSGPFARGVTAVYTKATIEAGALGEQETAAGASAADADSEDGGLPSSAAAAEAAASRYLVAVVEEPARHGGKKGAAAAHGDGGKGGLQAEVDIGLVALDASTGLVLHSQFSDGLLRSRLEAALLCAPPAELLVADNLSAQTLAALHALSGTEAGLAVEALELPPLALRALAHAADYLSSLGLAAFLRPGSGAASTASARAGLSVGAPAAEGAASFVGGGGGAFFRPLSDHGEMRLSPNTLRQLEVLQNCDSGAEHGSLLWLLRRTRSAAGGRLLRSWVARPLTRAAAIAERLDAVQELLERPPPAAAALAAALRSLPDLERSLARAAHATATPAAVLALLRALASLPSALRGQAGGGPGSPLSPPAGSLGAAASPGAAEASIAEADAAAHGGAEPPGGWPGVSSSLLSRTLREVADPGAAGAALRLLRLLHEDAAAANDKMHLFRDEAASFPEVAARRADVAAAEAALAGLLPGIGRAVGLSGVKYVNVTNQGDYLVEVPVDRAKSIPTDWTKVSSTKKVVRCHPPAVRSALSTLQLARDRLAGACGAAWRQYLALLGAQAPAWRGVLHALARFDVLAALADVASADGYTRPELAAESEPPQLRLVGARHPVLGALLPSYTPNDLHLQGDGLRCLVVTGPNAGGKSSFVRTAALIAVMAQVGSFVPATSARLRPFDAVFTRMGAADNLALGRSTFEEELSDVSSILSSATSASLVVIDELGRGTSTHDGVAIAQATLEHLAVRLRPLCLFVSHYPEVAALERELAPAVEACHMAYVEHPEGEGAGGADRDIGVPGVPTVTFLYRATAGAAPSSFGLNVARMAGLPGDVLRRAAAQAAWLGGSTQGPKAMPAAGEGGGGQLESLVREVRAALAAGDAPQLRGLRAEAARLLGAA